MLGLDEEARALAWRRIGDLQLSADDPTVIFIALAGVLEKAAVDVPAAMRLLPERVEEAARRAVGEVSRSATAAVRADMAETADLVVGNAKSEIQAAALAALRGVALRERVVAPLLVIAVGARHWRHRVRSGVWPRARGWRVDRPSVASPGLAGGRRRLAWADFREFRCWEDPARKLRGRGKSRLPGSWRPRLHDPALAGWRSGPGRRGRADRLGGILEIALRLVACSRRRRRRPRRSDLAQILGRARRAIVGAMAAGIIGSRPRGRGGAAARAAPTVSLFAARGLLRGLGLFRSLVRLLGFRREN